MNRYIQILIILMAVTTQLQAQKNKSSQFRIAFYNTENIFDTLDDPNKTDEDFLPSAKVAWTGERYGHKLQQIAKVLVAIDSVNLVEVIGLAEIENMAVLKELVTQTPLSKGKYQVILEEGSDPRGIDVALMFRPEVLTYISHHAFPSAQSFKTRNVLYVQLADAKKETFHFFVNHWKSRSGGANETEPQRIENAATLKHVTDSIMIKYPGAKIIIMGDLNDEPSNKSIASILEAGKPEKKAGERKLYNLFYDRFSQGEGTLYYKDWDLFDQIIVSGTLLNKKPGKGALITAPYGYIFRQDWMLYKNKTGEMVPNRTAGSKEYFGGFSDHLPVYTVVNY
jgi:predicted extracellular nuclease